MLWVDEDRPRSLEQLTYHVELAERMKSLVVAGDFPHIMLYGPSGAGKKTRAFAMIREVYGPGIDKVKVKQKNFKAPSGTEIELSLLSSNFHIEMTPSQVGFHDRVVVGEVIKEIAQSPAPFASKVRFKVVVLNECDRLTVDAQHALRRTMEKYASTCRLVLISSTLSRIIPALRSRCLCIRVGAPTTDEILCVMDAVVEKHKLSPLPPDLARRIVAASDRNLRRALLTLETCRVAHYPWVDDQPVEIPPWEQYVLLIAREITEEQSARRILAARTRFYELLSRCIPAEIILKKLAEELLKKVDDDLRFEVVKLAAFYEHRIQKGTKAIFHLEAFVAKFMHAYKAWILANDLRMDVADSDDEFDK